MPESQAQVRMAAMVMKGKSNAMPKSAAREMLDKMRGKKMSMLPERKHAALKKVMDKRHKSGH